MIGGRKPGDSARWQVPDESITGSAMISFTLSPTPVDNGQMEIVLRLYRQGKLASVTPVATVHRSLASMVMLRCRVHLRNLGVGEATNLRSAG